MPFTREARVGLRVDVLCGARLQQHGNQNCRPAGHLATLRLAAPCLFIVMTPSSARPTSAPAAPSCDALRRGADASSPAPTDQPRGRPDALCAWYIEQPRAVSPWCRLLRAGFGIRAATE